MRGRRRFTASDLDAKPAKRQGGPSRNEARYQQHLDTLVAAGEVLTYSAQPDPIEIAHRCSYQADFLVLYADGRPDEYVEIKGAKGKRPWFRDDGARVKVKVAARELARRGLRCVVVVVWPQGKRWMREVVRP